MKIVYNLFVQSPYFGLHLSPKFKKIRCFESQLCFSLQEKNTYPGGSRRL